MIAKRATKQLREAGIDEIVIRKGSYGYSLHNPSWARQKATVHKTAVRAVKAAITGERPEQLPDTAPSGEFDKPASYGEALTLAMRKAKYGHHNWIVWLDKQGNPQAEKVTPETMKRCLLDVGTKGRWTLVVASSGSLMKGFWGLGLAQIGWAKRGFRIY